MLDAKNKKMLITAGIGITAYHAASMSYDAFPKIDLLTTQLLGTPVTPLLIAAGVAAYGIFVLWNDY